MNLTRIIIEQKKILDNIFSVLEKVEIPRREEIYKEIRACGVSDLTE
jgi:hypothetical protein